MARASKTGIKGLYRGKDGRWYIHLRWTHPTTGASHEHRETLPVGTPSAAAKRRAMMVLAASIDGTLVPQGEPSPTTNALGPALDAYAKHCEESGLASLPTKRGHVKKIRATIGETRTLASLTLADCEKLIAVLRDVKDADGKSTPRANGTINRHLVTLRAFLSWAGKRGLMDRAHARLLCDDLDLLPEPPGRVRAVHPDEREAFANMTGWLRPITDAARLTGMRLGELTGLRWSAVNMSEGSITLTKTKANKVRTVAILPELRAVLESVPRGIGAAFVFPIPRGRRNHEVERTEEHELLRRRDAASLAFARWAAEHEIEGFRFHDTRHDAASSIRRAGHGLDVIAKVLGHGSLAMSARYAHLPDDATTIALASVTLFARPLPVGAASVVNGPAANDTEETGTVGGNSKRAKGFEPSTFSMGSGAKQPRGATHSPLKQDDSETESASSEPSGAPGNDD